MAQAPAIRAIGRNDVHRITSGQVILDIQSATKELVENALDAGATSIEIRFKEHGAEAIEVIDNGAGIDASNYDALARKHYTSKIASFHDLTSVQTFGFRGEALSSLCELARVEVVTATARESPVGTIIELGRDGLVVSADKKVARQQGTTVTVSQLFHTLPVRRRELLKNIKREFAKAQTLLQAYAIVSRGVRWVVSNTVKGKRTPVMTITAAGGGSTATAQMSSNVTAVFGPKVVTQLAVLDVRIPRANGEDAEHSRQDDENDCTIHVTGLVSRPVIGSGRASSDRSFLYINGRPWDAPKVVRVFNEIYRQYNVQQYPMVIANFCVAGHDVDINVSPDKRTLFLAREGEVLEGLRTGLEQLFAPHQQSFKINDPVVQSSLGYTATCKRVRDETPSTPPRDSISDTASEPGAELADGKEDSSEEEEEEAVGRGVSDVRPIPKKAKVRQASPDLSRIAPGTSLRVGRNASHATIEKKLKETSRSDNTYLTGEYGEKDHQRQERRGFTQLHGSMRFDESDEEVSQESYSGDGIIVLEDGHKERPPRSSDHDPDTATAQSFVHQSTIPSANELVLSNGFDEARVQRTPEISAAEVEHAGQIVFDLDLVRSRLCAISDPAKDDGSAFQPANKADEAAVAADTAAAEAALSRTISKTDFAEMQIVGQFNLGFIVVRRRTSTGEDDLFIVDQHAADEKYNFEMLTATTRLQSQPLIAPRTLQLSPADELVAAEHGDAMAAHGFSVTVDEEAPPGSRITLTALPMSRQVALGVGDLEELLHRLADERPAGERARTMRCSKVRALLASRACRRSIMIGTALNQRQMQTIVAHLGSLDQPWNCPHGRPTMRHLLTLATYKPSQEIAPAEGESLTWESLA